MRTGKSSTRVHYIGMRSFQKRRRRGVEEPVFWPSVAKLVASFAAVKPHTMFSYYS